VEPLIGALREMDEKALKRAISALDNTTGKTAIEPLIPILKDKNEVVRQMAAASLIKITGKDFGQDIGKWQTYVNEAASLPLTDSKL